MYNLKVNEILEYVSKENIFKYITSEDIFDKYLGFSQKNIMFKSPLRNDKQPTCKLFIGRKGQLLYIDFGEPNSVCDGIGFVQKMYNLTFEEALNKIAFDMNLPLGIKGLIHTDIKPINTKELNIIKKENKSSELLVKTRRYEDYDFNYWNQFGINLETLKLFNVYPVHVVYKNNKTVWINKKDNPIYCYRFKNNKKKCYRPLEPNKRFKFITSSEIGSIIQGYDQLPNTGEVLIITKSLKDIMCLYELGYASIAPNGEAYNITTELIQELKQRFKHIFILYDNDIAGINNAEYLSTVYNLPTIYLPFGDQKDISDYHKKYGREKSLNLLNHLINI